MSLNNNWSILKVQYDRDIVARLNELKGDILKLSLEMCCKEFERFDDSGPSCQYIVYGKDVVASTRESANGQLIPLDGQPIPPVIKATNLASCLHENAKETIAGFAITSG
uniref:Uncharacterized protein n=1 Tax=Parascaris equorum TaxID=6256 RepID=A0A914R146_PAREQ